MRTKRTPRPRNTLAKKIRALPLPFALQVAMHGRTLSPIQAACFEYLQDLNWCRLCRESGDKQSLRAFGHAAMKTWSGLAIQIMAAVQDRNATALRELAAAVEAFRPVGVADPIRTTLLLLKSYTLKTGHKFTLKDVARVLRISDGDDLSRLRTTTKEIKFPLAAGKVGRPRIIKTRKHNQEP